jgi:2,3-bisphosphoglycerate-dependent phosphoglycerate mutase
MPVIDESCPPRRWQLGELGRRQSEWIARKLPGSVSFIYSSREPKAHQTAKILGWTLGLEVIELDGLEEFDRPALPLMSKEEHQRLNREIFDSPDRRVLGDESANAALERFEGVVKKIVFEEKLTEGGATIVVTHGTVISLFVAKYNPMDAFELWGKLSCPSFVELQIPDFRLVNVVSQISE